KIVILVHIGLNVIIGNFVYVASQSTIAGSCIVEDFAEIWTAVGIADNIKIGYSSSVGIGSIVIQSVPDKKKCFGNPARVIGTND
ncbi:MAG: acyl-(acyl-carrier-protein)--UDP-N-acetylglucosamine O-acyltransferase, partial [Segetibacter sp.]|nr:acyl-(acyl-carrier-protein)--UDP-N-acetylglucosamine O-acyltransferase [Segetibacter sp.]